MNVKIPSLLFPIFLLFTIGLLMIFDASSGEIVDSISGKNQLGSVVRQLVWGIVGSFVAYSALKIGAEKIFEKSFYIYAVLIVLLVCVFIPGIGVSANGSRRWVKLFGFHLQPSEFVKIFLPAYFVFYCSSHPAVFTSLKEYLKFVAFLSVPIVLILLEPNNSTAGVIVVLMGVMTLVCNIPARFWALPLLFATLALSIFAASSPYVRERLSSYRNPESDIKGKGHQPFQAKIAAGSGGVFGKGPAKSMQKLSYLPEAQNDYIAAIYAEEFGFAGMTILIGIYLWLFHEVWKCIFTFERFEYFAWGIGFLFLLSFQTFMNLGVVSGLLPSTGLNLPFFSQGGSSLMANSIGVGILLSIKR